MPCHRPLATAYYRVVQNPLNGLLSQRVQRAAVYVIPSSPCNLYSTMCTSRQHTPIHGQSAASSQSSAPVKPKHRHNSTPGLLRPMHDVPTAARMPTLPVCAVLACRRSMCLQLQPASAAMTPQPACMPLVLPFPQSQRALQTFPAIATPCSVRHPAQRSVAYRIQQLHGQNLHCTPCHTPPSNSAGLHVSQTHNAYTPLFTRYTPASHVVRTLTPASSRA